MDEFAPVMEEFRLLKLAREHFPMWTDWGIGDESTSVHSLGLNYLVCVGQACGFAACSEFPVDGSVRADAIWWDKQTRKAVAVFEFERHKDGSELREKVQNLLLAYHRFKQQPRYLGLVYWTKNFYPLAGDSIGKLWTLFRQGFTTSSGERIAGADPQLLRVHEVQHRSGEKGVHLLNQVYERKRA